MKKNDIITLEITDISTNAEGIGRYDGLAFFVKNAVTGDKVEAVITKLKKGYGYAKMLRLISPSPDRVTPVCKSASACGGCQIMQLSYEKQLEFKENKVRGNIEHIGGFNFCEDKIEFLPIIGMTEFVPLHYRNKMQFPVGTNKEGHMITGFYAGRTHYIVESENCPVSKPENSDILKAVCSFAESAGISVYDETTGKGILRHILIRNGFYSKQIMVCIVINAENIEKSLCEKLVQISLDTNENISCICLNINKSNTNVILGDKIKMLYGTPFIEDTLKSRLPGMLPLKFQISPLSFFQTNPMQTEKLYDCALEFADLSGSETVWDLYCGTGSISLFLAQIAKKVYGVEIVPEAIEDAKKNAEINGIKNAEFICGRSEDVFTKKTCDMPSENLTVVLDPPRKGCDVKLLNAIKQVGPEKIVYVSCDSATLARDLKILCEGSDESCAVIDNNDKNNLAFKENNGENGIAYEEGNGENSIAYEEGNVKNGASYKIEKIRPVDMFPHTVHVETVCLLSKLHEAKHHVNVTVDMDELDLTAAESKATYEEIKQYVAENNDGMKVSSLYIAQVKQKHGITRRENYNKSKSDTAKQPQCPKEKEEAIVEALKHFGMIQ